MTSQKQRRASITVKDVARLAQVGPATAARALGSYGAVSDEVRERVLEAARELGYRRNDLARSMITRTTHTLGLVVADLENPFFAHIARAVTDVARRHGYALLVANSDERKDEEREAVHVFVGKQVDGLIVVPASPQPYDYLADLPGSLTPLVLLDRSVQDLHVDTVLVDNHKAAFEAIQCLTSLGHRRVGMVTASEMISSTSQRIAGYRDALKAAGGDADTWIRMADGYSSASAQAATARLLAESQPPTAIFATDSFMTSGVYRAIVEAGLRIPDDISLIGFDDEEWMQMVRPAITVVQQPVYELGRLAAERLLARIEGDDSPPRTFWLRSTLIERESCAPPRQP